MWTITIDFLKLTAQNYWWVTYTQFVWKFWNKIAIIFFNWLTYFSKSFSIYCKTVKIAFFASKFQFKLSMNSRKSNKNIYNKYHIVNLHHKYKNYILTLKVKYLCLIKSYYLIDTKNFLFYYFIDFKRNF